MEAFERHVRAAAYRRAAAIERAVEEALHGGEHGVLVDETKGWARPHVSVPYGEVHYLPRRRMGESPPAW